VLRQSGRAAFAATLAYLVALPLSSNEQPLLAPLTALLVADVSVYATLRQAVDRVGSVVAGVLLALGFSALVGFSWWSLSLLLAAAVAVATLLRLGAHATEVPISAMFVLAVGAGEAAATGRVVETLLGAGIGILVNGVLASRVRVHEAGAAVEELAAQLAELLERMASELVQGASLGQARRWLADSREKDQRVAAVERTLVDAEESMRLNPRARGQEYAAPVLRGALDGLERSAVCIRIVARSMVELWARGAALTGNERAVVVGLLRALAGLLRAFGEATHARSHGGGPIPEARQADHLEWARRRRNQAVETLSRRSDDPELWPTYGAVFAGVDQLIAELDPAERAAAAERLRDEAHARIRRTPAETFAQARRDRPWRRLRLPRPRRRAASEPSREGDAVER
jgi:hypothetical protein